MPDKVGTAVAGEVAKFKPAPVNIDLIVNTSTTVSAGGMTKTQAKVKRYGGVVAL